MMKILKHQAKIHTIIAVVVFLIFLVPFWGMVIDDVYIHLQIARNLAKGEGWSFNRGIPTNGSTSPLWTLILTIPFLLRIDESEAVYFSKFISAFFGVVAVLFFHRLILKITSSRRLALIASLALASNVFLVMWSFSGMETSLSLLLIVLGLDLFFSRKQNLFGLGLVLGLACLTRPEFLILAFIFLIYFLFCERKISAIARFILGLCCPIVPWLVYSQMSFGTIWPNSFIAKSKISLNHTSSAFVSFSIYEVKMVALVLFLPLTIELFLLLLSRFGLRGQSGIKRDNFIPWLVAYLIFHLLFYYLEGVSLLARYIVPVIPVFLLVIFYWIGQNQNFLRLKSSVVVLICLAVVFFQMVLAWKAYRKEILTQKWNHMPALHLVADWIIHHTKASDKLACDDVGFIGFESQRQIIDLEGLISPEILPFLEDRTRYEEIMKLKPEYLIISRPEYYSDILHPISGRLKEVYRVKTKSQRSLDNTDRAFVVYKVNYSL